MTAIDFRNCLLIADGSAGEHYAINPAQVVNRPIHFTMLTILGYYRAKRHITFPFCGWKYHKSLELSEETPGERFFRAILQKDIPRLSELLKTKIREYVDPKTGRTGLMTACQLANLTLVKMMIDAKVRVNRTCLNGKNELVYLVETSNKDEKEILECCEVLVSAGVDYKACDKAGISVLSHSIRNMKYLPSLFLLDLGCCPDVPDVDGWTSTFYAAYTGDIRLCQILKDYNATFNLVDHRGRSPFEIARSKFHREAAEILYAKLPTIDDIIQKNRVAYLSELTYKMDQIPDASKGRNYGYQDDLLRLVDRLGLQFMVRIVLDNNLQLADFLTTTNQQLEDLGVWLSQDRKKILLSIVSFHNYPWGKSGISTEVSDPFDQVNVLANVLYQLHLMSSTTLYFKSNSDESSQDLTFLCNKGLEYVEYLINEYNEVIKIAKTIDNLVDVIPCDYIGPKRQKKRFNKNFLLPVCAYLVFKMDFVSLFENILLNSLPLSKF